MGGDTGNYLRMVQDSYSAAPAPYAYRILVPFIVKLMPLPPELGFLITTGLGLFVSLVLSYLLLRRLGFGHVTSSVTMLMLSMSFPIAFYAGTWGWVDPVAYALLLLSLWYAGQHRYGLSVLVLVAGTLAKETVLIGLPLLVATVWKSQTQSRKIRSLFAAAILFVAGVSYWLVRYLIDPVPGRWDVHGLADLWKNWQFILTYNLRDVDPVSRIGREFLRSYGFLWIAAFLGWKQMPRLRWVPIYFLTFALALCFVATDWSRMLGWAFPGVFLPVAWFLQRYFEATAHSGKDGVSGYHAGYLLQHRMVLRKFGPVAALLMLGLTQCWLSLMGYSLLDDQQKIWYVLATVMVFLLGSGLSVFVYLQGCPSNQSVMPARSSVNTSLSPIIEEK